MKQLKLLVLALAGLFTVASTQVQAEVLPGDVGSAECRALQAEVQASLGSEPTEPTVLFRNPGQFMKTVQQIVSPELEAGNITEECSSCITNQYARRIPVEEQGACGPESPNPECAPATCDTFIPCDNPVGCAIPICVSIAEGGGVCHEGTTACGGLTNCSSTADCAAEPPGTICALQTCCGVGVCLPPSTFCNP